MRRCAAAILLFLPLFVPPFAFAVDNYAALENLTAKEKLPRILNTDDIPDLRPTDPQPLFSPAGDFNGDRIEDVALSGLYDLAPGATRYFLLVAAQFTNPARFQSLHYQEFARPVFIHRPGTTGEEDPGDQAFSVSLCANCQEGWDFYWNKRSKKFDLIKWIPNNKRLMSREALPAAQVPAEVADEAIRIISLLKDVAEFVRTLKSENRALAVRAEPAETGKNQVWVAVLEKKDGGEKLYDRILVDLGKKKAIRRERKPSLLE